MVEVWLLLFTNSPSISIMSFLMSSVTHPKFSVDDGLEQQDHIPITGLFSVDDGFDRLSISYCTFHLFFFSLFLCPPHKHLGLTN